jgi:hypothetical protein
VRADAVGAASGSGRRGVGLGKVCVAGVAFGVASVAFVLGLDVEPE